MASVPERDPRTEALVEAGNELRRMLTSARAAGCIKVNSPMWGNAREAMGVWDRAVDARLDDVIDTREAQITELEAQLADQIRLTDQKHNDCNSALTLAIKLCRQREDMERELKAESARVAELEKAATDADQS